MTMEVGKKYKFRLETNGTEYECVYIDPYTKTAITSWYNKYTNCYLIGQINQHDQSYYEEVRTPRTLKRYMVVFTLSDGKAGAATYVSKENAESAAMNTKKNNTFLELVEIDWTEKL